MKFENKYPNAKQTDRFEFEYSYVTKSVKLGRCRRCDSFTRWIDVLFQAPACSEECLAQMWKQYKADNKNPADAVEFDERHQRIKQELVWAEEARSASKDILIIVHNQLDYLKQCLDSIHENTENYHIYIWDNDSGQETKDFIENLVAEHDHDCGWGLTTMRSNQNLGFIEPNNELASWGESEYIILLNSDTKVFQRWDRAMTGFMEKHPKVAQVGYWGGHLGPDGRGFGGANGFEIDYVPGWCFCITRATYDTFGLFNKQLRFAYCEDADLSLRLKTAGHDIYALHAPLVHHYQNKTIVEVEKTGQIDVAASFQYNHEYMREKWKDYLAHERVLLKRKESNAATDT